MINKKYLIVYLLMPVLIIAVFLFSLLIGSNEISFFDVTKSLLGNTDENIVAIIKNIRFPRIIMACIT